eukprot:745724-Pelagomonas_calceolata.AAC.2
MLVENVTPAADQPESWAVGQPLLTPCNFKTCFHLEPAQCSENFENSMLLDADGSERATPCVSVSAQLPLYYA